MEDTPTPYVEMDTEEQGAGSDGELVLDRANMRKLAPILLGSLLVSMNVSIVAPFFPVYATDRYNASSLIIAVIFAAYPVASMASAPAVGMLCNRYSRLQVLRAGLLLNALGLVLFVMKHRIPRQQLYIFTTGNI